MKNNCKYRPNQQKNKVNNRKNVFFRTLYIHDVWQKLLLLVWLCSYNTKQFPIYCWINDKFTFHLCKKLNFMPMPTVSFIAFPSLNFLFQFLMPQQNMNTVNLQRKAPGACDMQNPKEQKINESHIIFFLPQLIMCTWKLNKCYSLKA